MTSPFQPKRINIPGVLSDDALQEQLKQFASGKNALQAAAPPPNSAVEFSSKIQNDFLSKPTALARTAAPFAGPLGPLISGAASAYDAGLPQRSAQTEAVDVRSDILSEGLTSSRLARDLVLGPIAGELAEGGILNSLGQLDTPEARQAEAERREVDAKANEAVVNDQAAMRAQLRGMTDLDAAWLGLPTAPGGIDNETRDMLEAADQQIVKAAETKTKDATAAVSDPAKQPTQKWWLDAMQRGARGSADVPISMLKAPAIAWELTTGRFLNGGDIEKSSARAWVDVVDQTLTKMLPGDKTRAKDLVSQLGAGTGSMLGFMMTGYIGAAIGLPATTATRIAGAATGAVSQYEDAELHNAVGLQKYMAFLLGGAMGISEAWPINNMMFRANSATGGAVQRMLTKTAAGSMEEFIQEMGQAFGADVIAKWTYDAGREYDLQSYLKQGVVGAITGGLGGAAGAALNEAGVTGQPPLAPITSIPDPFAQEALLTSAMDEVQAQIDALPGMADAAVQTDAEALVGDAPIEYVQVLDEPLANMAGNVPKPAAVKGPGGTIPVREDGKFEATHWSRQPLDLIDPAKRGTGPLKGVERQRLGAPGADPNVVDRSYLGVGDPNFPSQFEAQNAKLPPRKRGYMAPTDPYHGENLGPYQHTVAVDPNTIYNWYEDPQNLKAKLDRSTPATEQVTAYEKLIRDAGFKGVYISESRLGQTAMLFEPTAPERVTDTVTGMRQNFEVPDVKSVEVPEADVAPLPGLTASPGPVRSVVQAARAYAGARGLPIRRQAEYVKADAERGKRIADAYEKMKHAPNDPKVKAAYKAMADETLAQYQFVKATGLKVEAIEPGMADPYPEGPKQVLEDLQKGHLWFYPTDQGFGSSDLDVSDNPLLAETAEKIGDRTLLVNDVFRIVHDFFGHGIEGSGFGARGEENAWQSHMRLYSSRALPAVTSETRGQNSWVNFGPYGEANRRNQKETVYADQKTGIMPSWTWTEGVADDGRAGEEADLFARIETPERVAKLADQVPGLKGVMKHMTPDERAKLSKANAAKIVDIFTNLPDAKEMAAVAYSGRAKRGWYQRSAEALVDIFGLQDAPRFAALLAALSPQTSVESNAVNALYAWTNWTKAGRPTDAKAITRILGQSVQGSKGEDSVLPAWINNSITALTEPDATAITLSGPKVDSFMKNLQGRVIEVTNDAWMANFANVDQTLFKKTGPSPGKGAGYVAMSAAVRQAADVATKMTGETWTPAEIQETVWSWAKTLYEKAGAAGEVRSAAEIIAAGDMTAEEIGATPDFASLFVGGVYRNILEKGGYDLERVAAGGGNADGGSGKRGSPVSAEGAKIAQGAFDKHLRRAAQRLDALRERRAAGDRVETFNLDETFFPGDTGTAAAPTAPRSNLATEDELFLDQGLLANVGSRNKLKAEQTRPDKGIATPADTAPVDVSLSRISQNVVKLLDLTARQGRFTLKGAIGQYDRKQDTTRVRNMSDLSTVVHEGGHAIYFAAGPQLKQFIASNDHKLMDVATNLYGGDTSTMPKATHVAEGFAEFFRVYTLNRAYVDRKYGQLAADFDKVLDAADPTLKKGLELVGQDFATWLQLPSAQLVKNMIVSGKQDTKFEATLKELKDAGIPTWIHEKARNAVAAGINRNAGLNDLVTQILNRGQANLGQAIDLKRADDPRALLVLSQNAGSRAMIQTTDGVYGHHSTQPFTRGLREALLRSQGQQPDTNLGKIDPVRQQDFAAYLVALRGIDEYRRFAEGKIERPPLGATLGDLKVAVKEFEGQYGADFIEAAKIAHEYGMGLWKKSFDAGLMSKETYMDGLERQFYVPLQRDMSDKKTNLGLGNTPITSGQSIVKRFKGSDRNIIDPMDVLMHKTFALEQVIAQNEVVRTLAGLADKAGKAGALVERVPAQQIIGKQWSVKDVARQLTNDDTISEADAVDLMTILEPAMDQGKVIKMFMSEQAKAAGENVVFYWDAGRLSAIQLADGDIGADVVNVLNGVGRENLPMFVDLIAASSTAFRAAITSWPDFLAVNFIRDQFSTFILTDVGYKPFVSGLRGVGDELRQKQWAKQYNAAMGTMGGMNVASLHTARIKKDIAALRKKGYVAKAFNEGGFTGAVKGMSKIVELTETGTRLGVFRKSFERAKIDGLTDWEASIEAAYVATDLMNFGLNGSKTLLFRRTIPFLNAQLQGLYKMMRTLGADEVRQRKGLNFALRAYFKSTKNLDLSRTEKQALNTGRKAWIKMASLGLLSAALHFIFEDDPDYQEAGEYLRTTGWVIPTGDGRVFYVPKPFELAILANFVERGLEAANGDESAKGRFMRGLAMNLTPPTSPPALQVAVELAANKDFFSGREIVPSYMQALDPVLQYDNYTTSLAKQIGTATSMSPLKIDHVLSGLGASAYRDLSSMYGSVVDPNKPDMDMTDKPITRRFVRDVRRGSASSTDFWKTASTVDGSLRRAETSYKAYLEGGNEPAANQYLMTLDEDDRAYALLNTHFKADAKRLNPFYRARQLTSIVSAMRREMVSELGMEDTSTKVGGEIKLTSKEKADLDEALSEYARREMRNTLVAMGAPGWAGKEMLDTQSTIDLVAAVEPRVGEELNRRIKKANVYSFDAVNTYWPEAKDRLLRDHENTFLKDLVTVAKVAQ